MPVWGLPVLVEVADAAERLDHGAHRPVDLLVALLSMSVSSRIDLDRGVEELHRHRHVWFQASPSFSSR